MKKKKTMVFASTGRAIINHPNSLATYRIGQPDRTTLPSTTWPLPSSYIYGSYVIPYSTIPAAGRRIRDDRDHVDWSGAELPYSAFDGFAGRMRGGRSQARVAYQGRPSHRYPVDIVSTPLRLHAFTYVYQ